MILRQTSLSANIIQFCRFLRLKGFASGIEEESLVLQALEFVKIGDSSVFYDTLKAILCRTKTQAEGFEKLYNEYWKELAKAVDSKEKKQEKKLSKPSERNSFKSLQEWLHGNQNQEKEETATYSPAEIFSKRDFSAFNEDETAEIIRNIKLLAKSLAAKLSRRYEPANRNGFTDIRRTLRKNMRCGGELLDIAQRRTKRNRTKLIAICDVSRSMELYSGFLIQLLYSLQQVYSRMESFIFSTSLQRVTKLLQERDFGTVKQLMTEEDIGWSDGTRIGESLEAFINQFGNRLLNSKTIVIILSDGWDNSGIEKIVSSMRYIQKRAKRIIWLNPLAGYEEYRPETKCMSAALPYIDVFAPVHNLDSLKRLKKWL